MKTIIFLVLLSLSSTVFANDQCKKNVSIDHYKLRYEWEPTSCTFNQCKPNFANNYPSFVVHGLWPNSYSSWETSYCCNNKDTDVDRAVNPLANELKQIWIEPADLNFNRLWRHEFRKHGTCAQHPKLEGVKNYFSYTLSLAKQISINRFMDAKGFKATQNYSIENFLNAFQQQYGVYPEIRCRLSNGKSYLENIAFCFDPNLKMVNCRLSPDCKNLFTIPTYNTKF